MTCQDLLNAQLPSPLPMVLAFPEDPTLSDTSIDFGLFYYLTHVPVLQCLVGQRIYPSYQDRFSPTTVFPCIVYEFHGAEAINCLTGSAGATQVDLELSCYSSDKRETVQLAELLRLVLHGFQGWWGTVPVWKCLRTDYDDDCDPPKDSSGRWWLSRSLTFDVGFYEQRPAF